MTDLNFQLKYCLKRLIKLEQSRLSSDEAELNASPCGFLKVRFKNEKLFFTKCDDYGERGITKDEATIHRLARKRYLAKSISVHRENISAMESCLNNIPSFTYSYESKFHSPILDESLYTPKERSWLNDARSCNSYMSENLIYKTATGILVRSKSERTIADRLSYYGLVYKYEPQMTICGHIFYPDFVILKRDGTIVIWEHNGLMDDENYAMRASFKMRQYNKAGYKTHTNLIITDEKDIFDVSTIDDIIFKYIFL